MANIHEILGLKHAVPILESLGKHDKLNWSKIVYNIVKNSSVAERTLDKLEEAGFIKKSKEKKNSIFELTKLGREALEYARQGCKIGGNNNGRRK